MGRVWFTDFEHISTDFEDLTVVSPRVTNAYFAKKVVTRGDEATGTEEATGPTVDFEEIHEGILGRDVYIIVETENFVPPDQPIVSTERANVRILLKTGDCNLTGTADETIQITDGTADVDEFIVQVGDTEVLNDIEGNCAYTNLDDFADKAIFKLSLRPHTRATFDTWAETIYDAGTDLPSIEIEVTPEDEELYVVYGAEGNEQGPPLEIGRFANSEGSLFRLENKNVYEIYHGDNLYNNFDQITVNGTQIRRRIGNIDNNWARVDNYDENDPKHNVIYFYFDNNDTQHEVCTTEKHRTTAKVRVGNIPPEDERGQLLETVDFSANRTALEDISASSLEIYENGTYSDDNGSRPKWYANQNNQVFLVDADIENEAGVGSQVFDALEFNDTVSGLRIAFGYQDTRRRYANPAIFAAVIGALSELNLNEDTSNIYIISEGFAYKDGSCYPSSGHVNGLAFDTHYINNHNHQQAFINALTNYGFGRNIVGCNMYYDNGTRDCNPRQPGTINAGGIHENHLHSDTFLMNRIQNIN